MTTRITQFGRLAALGGALLLAACSASRKAAPPPPATQAPADTLLAGLLRQHPADFDSVLRNAATWGVQVLYTRIDRDAANRPRLSHHSYALNPDRYFYPASTVKLPVAALALQRLQELKGTGADRNSTLITEAATPRQTAVYNDPSSPDGRPTVAQYIRKILLVSDNDAYNRLYEFLGQEYINRELQRRGYDSVQIVHRLNIFLPEAENRAANPVRLLDSSGRLLHRKPLERSGMVYHVRHDSAGTGFYRGDSLVRAPFDFSKKNRLPLRDLHSILISLILPEAVPERQRFRISEDDRAFLLDYISRWPRESDYPAYDSSYKDTYSKLLLYGGEAPAIDGVRVYNKEGDAYGFLIDAAYIVDKAQGIEFFLSAVISCNPDGIYNDDRYAYRVGFRFLQRLGEVLLEHERARPRERKADLGGLPR
ncbi:serine hydrolase [Flaviaesturariibacter amylovorans]